jgi:hypothetical protein
MADRTDNNPAVRNLALACGVLALYVGRHYGYYLATGANRAHVWNISGAVISMLFAVTLFILWPSRLLAIILAWIAMEEISVIACAVAYILRPWYIPEGGDVCSSALGLNLSAVGTAAIAGILLLIRTPSTDG